MKSQRFRKIVCWMTGMTLFFCLPFLPAMAEFYYVENEWNYVDGSMDISRGIPENATGVMDRIRRKGVLRVATEPYFAPQEFIDPEKSGMDQYAGADMELARMIASRMGVELEIVPMEYTQVLPALTDNLVDLTISAMAFTPRRAASYTMSKGYYFTESAATTAFVIRESDRELYTSVEDLYDKTLIVQSSSLQEALVAVGIVDLETAQTYIRNNQGSGLILAEGLYYVPEEQYLGNRVIAKKGELQLIYFVNGVIDEILESGTYEKWIEAAQERADELGL